MGVPHSGSVFFSLYRLPQSCKKEVLPPSQYTSWHLKEKKSLNYCTQLLAFASRCASETKITGPGSLSSAQEGSPAALLGILGGAILKCKRGEVQQLTSIVGRVPEEGGPRPSGEHKYCSNPNWQ